MLLPEAGRREEMARERAGSGVVGEGTGPCVGGVGRQAVAAGVAWVGVGAATAFSPREGRYQNCHHSTEGCQMHMAQLGTVLGGARAGPGQVTREACKTPGSHPSCQQWFGLNSDPSTTLGTSPRSGSGVQQHQFAKQGSDSPRLSHVEGFDEDLERG